MIEFKFASHLVRPGIQVVEVLVDGCFVCTITPDDSGSGIRLLSGHIGYVDEIPGDPTVIQVGFRVEGA